MHTAVVTVKGPDGQPLDDAMVVLVNADDMRRYVGFVVVVDGEARVSVPSGHYVATADTWSEDGTVTLGYSDVSIGEDPVQDVVVDLSGPTVTPTVSTPVPTGTEMLDLDFAFRDAAAKPNTFGASYSFLGLGADAVPPRVLVNGLPAAGSVKVGVSWKQVTTDSVGRQVSYSTVDLYGSGVPATMAHKVVPATMARLEVSAYSDGLASGGVGYGAVMPEQEFSFGSVVTTRTLPAAQVAYLDSPAGVSWAGFAVASSYGEDPGFVDELPHTYPAAATTKVSWFKAPYTTGVPGRWPFGDMCASCRTATRTLLLFTPWTDADPAHFGELVSAQDGEPVTHLTVKRDGKVVFDKDDYFGALLSTPATKATYQAHLTVDRRLQVPVLAPSIETDLTFVSDASGTAESAKSCSGTFGTSVTACTRMPLLTAGLSAPVDLDDRLPARATAFGLTVGHLDGDAAVTKASLDVRVTGTQAWTSVPLTITGSGSYKAAFNAAAYKGKALDVRFDVSDAAGGRLVQTVTAAVKVATA